MANQFIPQPFQPGPRIIDGTSLNQALGSDANTAQDGIVALAGGGNTSASPAPLLVYGQNRIVTVASANDSVQLPPSTPGASVWVHNGDASHSVQVFANLSSSLASGVLDTINGTAGATGVAVASGKDAYFRCYSAGAWYGPVAMV